MVFSSYFFIFCFLPIFFLVYAMLPSRSRAWWITVASFVFYGWWRPEYCVLLIFTTVANYVCGREIHRNTAPRVRRAWLVSAVCLSLGLLAVFKYAGMFSAWARTVSAWMELPAPLDPGSIPILDIALPIGISFYTFQGISYCVDIYRREAPPVLNFVDFACYKSMFPQLIAGPIVRYNWIADELRSRVHTVDKAAAGVHFFVRGLAKKVLLADVFALAVPLAFGDSTPGFAEAWIGVLGYALQIYFDFSGYSDMAAGLGLMMGFSFPQNFDSPYKADSITDFWRRWHMSLSTWLRDYLYIPLGGSRLGSVRTYVNLILVMLLGGLWHGASIVFVLWGLWHGVLLAVERGLGARHPVRWLPRPLSVLLTFFLVIVGWVLFRSTDLDMATRVLAALFQTPRFDLRSENVSGLLVVAIPLGLLACWWMPNTWEQAWTRSLRSIAWDCALFAISTISVLSTQASPFLYFRF